MNILAFDTTLNKTYLALQKGDAQTFSTTFCTIESDEKNYHSAYLISRIKSLLEENSLKINELDFIATGVGPGSFTGIRVCTTVARTIAQQIDTKIIPINSLELIQKAFGAEKFPVAMDARKNMRYIYDGKGEFDGINLVSNDELNLAGTLICDASSYKFMSDKGLLLINYEEVYADFPKALLELANEKSEKALHWASLKPLYIQPPPIHGR